MFESLKSVIYIDEMTTKLCSLSDVICVLDRRIERLIESDMIEKVKLCVHEFVNNVFDYFVKTERMDNFTLKNLLTALNVSDVHGFNKKGESIDYSTFIRKLNPTEQDSEKYFVIGRFGSINGSECTEKSMLDVSVAEKFMMMSFYHARKDEPDRGAPLIPVEDFAKLLPKVDDDCISEGLLDVCFSDGAWELFNMVVLPMVTK